MLDRELEKTHRQCNKCRQIKLKIEFPLLYPKGNVCRRFTCSECGGEPYPTINPRPSEKVRKQTQFVQDAKRPITAMFNAKKKIGLPTN